MKILVLEDDDDCREILTFALGMYANAKIFPVNNIREAIKIFHSEQPHVIISDIRINGETEDGFSFINEVIEHEKKNGHRSKKIAITATHTKDKENSGFDKFIQKPFDIDELLNSLQAS